jgi:uncharacterized membrane protein
MTNIPPPTVPPATPPPPGGGSYTPPPPPPPGGSIGGPGGGPVSSDRSLMIALSYLGILALIPYLTKKNDPDAEVRWHAKNGMGLFIADVVIWVVFFVIGMVLRNTTIGCGMGVIQCVVWLALLALHIFCLIKAINGQRIRIPVVTDFAEKNL